MAEKSDLKDPAKESQKEAQKQFDSYYTVAKHKLGREPSFEEVIGMMSENSQQTQSVATPVASQSEPQEPLEKPEGVEEVQEGGSPPPRILPVRVYYGMSAKDGSDQKMADPNKILFYEDPTSGACYDCARDEWLEERPPVLDHLMSRPIENNERDIVAAIAHGVMDDESFDSLDKAGMVGDMPKALWQKTQQLQKDLAHLEELEAMEKSEAPTEEPIDPDLRPEGHTADLTQMPDNIDSIMGTAGVDRGIFNELAEVHGEDVAAQIMASAMKIALTNMEDQIRQIVREELASYVSSYDDEEEYEEESTPIEDEGSFEE